MLELPLKLLLERNLCNLALEELVAFLVELLLHRVEVMLELVLSLLVVHLHQRVVVPLEKRTSSLVLGGHVLVFALDLFEKLSSLIIKFLLVVRLRFFALQERRVLLLELFDLSLPQVLLEFLLLVIYVFEVFLLLLLLQKCHFVLQLLLLSVVESHDVPHCQLRFKSGPSHGLSLQNI